MWTRNYQNLINARSFLLYGNIESKTSVAGSTFNDTTPFTFKGVNGTVYNLCVGSQYVNQAANYSKSAFISTVTGGLLGASTTVNNKSTEDLDTIYVYFGSSTANEDFNDYKLTDIDGISSVGNMVNTVSKNSDGKYVCTITGIIKATNTCTISEFGLFRNLICYASTKSTEGHYRALIYRKVLDTPITLTAGQTASVSFSITLPTITIVQS